MITVVGEALIDLVAGRDGTTFHARPGGSPFNVAIATARLGAPARLLARLAQDRFGTMLRDHAAASGVDLSAAVSATEPTTLAVTSIDEHGGPTYDFYVDGTADWQWRDDELHALDSSAVVHFGSLASWMSPGDVVVHAAIARSRALVSYDPNIRPRLIGSRERAQAVVERNVAAADVVKASDEDLRWLYPGKHPRDIATRWLTGRPSLVLVTAGSSGATAHHQGGHVTHRPRQSVEVADTVGAGDAWIGSILADLHTLGATTAQSIQALTAAQIADLLDTATLVASITCGRQGADPPTANDVATARQQSPVLRALSDTNAQHNDLPYPTGHRATAM